MTIHRVSFSLTVTVVKRFSTVEIRNMTQELVKYKRKVLEFVRTPAEGTPAHQMKRSLVLWISLQL